ncbi:MAG: PQQ-binding-like beta-propeller repeat protein [Pirellulaceae bacterium]|nr:hypothetical protein [Planctomycetaceae bacterium]
MKRHIRRTVEFASILYFFLLFNGCTQPRLDPEAAETAIGELDSGSVTDTPSGGDIVEEAAFNDGESDDVVELRDLGTRKKGEDWPVFLGPRGDSTSLETGIITDWSAELRIVWTRPLKESYGIGTVSRGRYFQFDRVGDMVQLHCLNSETGEQIWTYQYPTDYRDMYGYNGGPRCSPLVDGNRVYVFGVEGRIVCLDVIDGAKVWAVDTAERFNVHQNFFGVGSNPVIFNDLLIVMVGGSPVDAKLPLGLQGAAKGNGSGIVAFDKNTGRTRYSITDQLASYASLKLAKIGSRDWCFAFARSGLVGFDPANGKIDFQYPWRARSLESVNASVPVVVGTQVFISETYGPGASLLNVRPGAYDVVWKDDDRVRARAFQAHWNTPIYRDGFLYGSSGRHEYDAVLRCIDWKTGEVKWEVPRLTRTSLMYVDDHFVCQGEDGVVRLIKVNPDRYEEVTLMLPGLKTPGAPHILLEKPCWAAPILSHGLMYLRGDDRVICVELIPEKE